MIPYRFNATGEVAINIKLVTRRGIYITSNTIKVDMIERPQADLTGSVTAEGSKGGRLADNVFGGQFTIFNGCDGVLDKPIIIAEGFDIGNETGVDDRLARYNPYLSSFQNHGYDLFFLNYANGQAAIQDNAQVLKRVINEMKTRIPIGDSIIIVGQNMSGLVARWALREMENDGQAHKVKLFISFDSGQQGSYTPPGLVALSRSIPSLAGWAAPLAQIFIDELRAIDSPASKQLLTFSALNGPHFTSPLVKIAFAS